MPFCEFTDASNPNKKVYIDASSKIVSICAHKMVVANHSDRFIIHQQRKQMGLVHPADVVKVRGVQDVLDRIPDLSVPQPAEPELVHCTRITIELASAPHGIAVMESPTEVAHAIATMRGEKSIASVDTSE